LSVQLYRGSVEIMVWATIANGGLKTTDRPHTKKLLTVTNRRLGSFSAPGGKIDEGESPEFAAARELTKETRLVPLRLAQIGGAVHLSRPKDDGPPWFCLAFLAEVGSQRPSQQEEGTEIGWHTPSDLRNDGLYPDFYDKIFPIAAIHYSKREKK